MRRFTKRKLFTYQFKGRKPRALLWRKAVYREWFEYGLLHQLRGGKIPIEFGDLSSFKNFEEWWRHPNYGFELFCEPYVADLAKMLDEPPKQIDKHSKLVEVSLVGDKDRILQDFKRVLRDRKIPDEYESRARFRPSKDMKFLKPKKLEAFRKTYLLTEKLKHTDVVNALKLIPAAIKP